MDTNAVNMNDLFNFRRRMSEGYNHVSFAYICNVLPEMKPGVQDPKLKKWLNIIPFEAEFVFSESDIKPGQKLADSDLREKFETWVPALMYLLDNYAADDSKKPELWTTAADKYLTDNDIIGKFLDENFEVTTNDEDCEPIQFVYAVFKSWIEKSYGSDSKEIITYYEFVMYLRSKQIPHNAQNISRIIFSPSVEKMKY